MTDQSFKFPRFFVTAPSPCPYVPGRFERNRRQLAGLAAYSRLSLMELRAETGIQYHQLSKGILHFCTEQAGPG